MITRFTGEEPSAAALYKELTPIIFPELVATKVSLSLVITFTFYLYKEFTLIIFPELVAIKVTIFMIDFYSREQVWPCLLMVIVIDIVIVVVIYHDRLLWQGTSVSVLADGYRGLAEELKIPICLTQVLIIMKMVVMLMMIVMVIMITMKVTMIITMRRMYL